MAMDNKKRKNAYQSNPVGMWSTIGIAIGVAVGVGAGGFWSTVLAGAIGGGVGGVVAANELHTRLKDRANIVVVEREPQQSFPPSYPWVMTGERQRDG